MERLYDNNNGYTDDALRISSRVTRYVENLIRERSEYSALELVALVHGAAETAFCTVSIERRLEE